jgi:hypothetical protein
VKSLNRISRRALGSIGLLAISLGLSASPALATPSLSVQLTRQASEVQVVSVKASGGQYRLRFDTGGPVGPGISETGDLAFNASTAQVEAALNALTNVDGAIEIEAQPGNYEVRFSKAPLANTDVPQLTAVDGTVPLSGPGSRVVTKPYYQSGVSRSDARLPYVVVVRNTGSDETADPVSVEMKLPAGLQSSVLGTAGTGWSCVNAVPAGAEPAKTTCGHPGALAPGASFPALTVLARLGADTPDHATANAIVYEGSDVEGSSADEFDFVDRPFAFDYFDSEVIDAKGDEYSQAGGHPYSAGIGFGWTAARKTEVLHAPIETPRKVIVDLPRGLVANALAVPTLCPSVEDVIAVTCPAGSAVGLINVDVPVSTDFGNIDLPVFAIEPESGLPAQFAFVENAILQSSFTLSPRLRADDGYAISLDVTPSPIAPPLRHLNEGLFCGFGAKVTGNAFEGCKEASEPSANPIPLATNPTRCTGTPPTTKVSTDSWEHPGAFISAEVSDPSNTGCESVDFQPEVSLQPTNKQADSPTGLNVEITMPTDGLESKTGLSQAALDNAVIEFPKGMSLNPAAAHGLQACSPGEVGLGTNDDARCPLASQVGTIEIETPLIDETLTGNVYLAAQKNNPFKSTLGLYLVFSSEKDGITIKVPGKLEPDPVTGQITSSFVENPEQPFSRLAIKFNSGPRAPLINPPTCGTYAIHSEMSPWSAASPANPTAEEIVSEDSSYQVTSGPNGGPCPSDPNVLDPKLDAGMRNGTAGSKSPFVLKLDRADGTQRFTGLDISMPKGVTAYLKGIPYCPDNVLAGISGEELAGAPELAAPSCPAASQVGDVQAGAGAGPLPFYAPGKAYLAGPYKGAPISIAVVNPAVAGPFDFGNVVIRNAVYIDPITAQVTVKSDSIPTMLHGILLDVRDIRVEIDRPGFTAAPTNCQPSSVSVHVSGELGSSANRSNRFQVGDCAALGFKPKLALRLFGGTKRGAHPRLKATLTARPGDANIGAASVALPHSEFLEQAHIRTVCTRVQFRADACPAGAIYGHAKAETPLLDNPLSGPVYLRSSDNPLPDLVAALRGPDSQPIEVVLAGRVDSVNGGIRTTFDVVPDQPVSTFTLSMKGGKKGLLVNSRDICKSVNRATAQFSGQNGKKATLRPKLQNSCKKKVANKNNKAKKPGRRSGR